MKALLSVVMTLVLVGPFDAMAQRVGRPPVVVPVHPIQCDVCTANGLSKAVVFGTFGTLRQLQEKMTKGEARSGDVQAVTASLKILFAHFDETGVTQAVEQAILKNEEEIIRRVPTRADADVVRKHHAAFGLKTTTDAELQKMETYTVNDRMRAIAEIKTGGLHAYYAHVLSRLEGLESKLAKAEKDGTPPLHQVVCDYNVVAGIFGIGCAFGCAGCCVVAAFAAFFGALSC